MHGSCFRCIFWNNSTLTGCSHTHTHTHRLGSAARVAVATGGQTGGNYSMIAFTSWDYGSLGDKETKLKQKNILYRLQVRRLLPPQQDHSRSLTETTSCFSSCQVDLEEERLKKQAAALAMKQKIFLYTLRVILLFLALGLIVAALVGIFLATQFSQVNVLNVERRCSLYFGHRVRISFLFFLCLSVALSLSLSPYLCLQEMSGQEGILGLIIQYLPSIVITAGNFVVPLLCDQIALLERYSPSVTIILALMRFAQGDLWHRHNTRSGICASARSFISVLCVQGCGSSSGGSVCSSLNPVESGHLQREPR